MTDVKMDKPFNKISVRDNSRKRRGWKLKDNPQDYKPIKMANITFLFCIIFEVVGIMTILFFGMVGAQMAIYFMTFLFSLFLWRKHKAEVNIQFKKVEPIKVVQLSAITVCGIPIALFLNYFAGILSNAGADSAEDVNTYPLILSLVVFAIVPAIVEEFVFRGVILGAYSKVDVKAGIVISSLFFALLHFSFGSVLYGFFFGLFFAVVRLSTGNLVYTIIMHCLFNTINVLMSYMRLDKIPAVVVFIVFAVALFGFITLVMYFFSRNTIDTHMSRSEGKYKPWKLITKEGYITLAVCVSVMGMLLMM